MTLEPLQKPRHPLIHAAIVAALILSAGLCLWRATSRGPGQAADIMTIYAATKAWATGGNPYDYAQLQQIARQAGCPEELLPNSAYLPSLYPPCTFVALSPLTLFDYRTAYIAWLIANLAFTALLIVMLLRLGGISFKENWAGAGLLAACVLAMGPLHSTLALGQSAVVAAWLLLAGAALAFAQAPRRWTAAPMLSRGDVWIGLAAGLATAIKPQLGGVLLLYLLLRLHRGVIIAAALLGAFLALGHFQLSTHGVHWLADLSRNWHAFNFGGTGDPTPANPNLDQLINLHHPFYALLADRAVVGVVVLALAGLVVAAAWLVRFRSGDPRRELLFLSILATVSLWAMTHRFYDCVLLVVPLAWVAGELAFRGRRRPVVWLCAALLAVFAVNLVAVMVTHLGYFPAALRAGLLWRSVILPHQAWALLALSLALCYALATTPADASSAKAAAAPGR